MFNWSDVHLYQSNFLRNPYFRTTTIYVAGTQEIEKERGKNNKIVEKRRDGFCGGGRIFIVHSFGAYPRAEFHLPLLIRWKFTNTSTVWQRGAHNVSAYWVAH